MKNTFSFPKSIFSFFKILLITILLCGFILLSIFAISSFMIIQSLPKIEPENIYSLLSQNSVVYDDQGHEIEILQDKGMRSNVPYKELPPDLVNAFVAIEDKTFWTHNGFNIVRIIGAVYDALASDSSIRGTSTLTQQLARDLYLTESKSERSFERKIKEAYYAIVLEKNLPKEKIMEVYLNTIYLGLNSYGVQSASQSFFSKDVKDLTLAECTILAAIPKNPSKFSPIQRIPMDQINPNNPNMITTQDNYTLVYHDAFTKRQLQILSNMKDFAFITDKQYYSTIHINMKYLMNPKLPPQHQTTSYFTDFAETQIIEDLKKKYKISQQQAYKLLYEGGLRIYTTLNLSLQSIIEEEFHQPANFPKSAATPEAAMVLLDYRTGEIKALVGGRYSQGKKLYNRATVPHQPGSAIKPLAVYAPALAAGYTPGSILEDSPFVLDGVVWPQNSYTGYKGKITMETAMQISSNVIAVKTLNDLGFEISVAMLKSLGITSLVEEGEVNDLNLASLGLGGMVQGISPLEMAGAYGSFANEGIYNRPTSYTKILRKNGDTVLSAKPTHRVVLEPFIAQSMDQMLTSAVSGGTGKNARISSQNREIPVAGKTGTTSNNYDAWFCGYTPTFAATLWIGADTNVPLSEGSNASAVLWSKIMKRVSDLH